MTMNRRNFLKGAGTVMTAIGLMFLPPSNIPDLNPVEDVSRETQEQELPVITACAVYPVSDGHYATFGSGSVCGMYYVSSGSTMFWDR
jgi:hypothetical protein